MSIKSSQKLVKEANEMIETLSASEVKKLAEIYFTDDAKAKHKEFVDSQAIPV